jgi:hypothetical protein
MPINFQFPRRPIPPVARVNGTLFTSMVEAEAATPVGGALEVLPGVHYGAHVTTALSKSMRVVGVVENGVRPTLKVDGSIRPAWGKAILVPTAPDITIEDLVLTGCMVPDSNGAGIRPEPTCTLLKINRVDCIENENGILAPDSATGQILITDSLFSNNGKATDPVRRGFSHNLYFNKCAKVVMTNCIIQNSYYGHELKSRALSTELRNVSIYSGLEGCAIDLPNGGILYVTASMLQKPANSNKSILIGIEAEPESGVHSNRSYVIENSVLDNQRPIGVIVKQFGTTNVRVMGCQMPGRTAMEGPVTVS